ncbi:hypothetical protein [Methanogenium cariaci]|nr:hypothetical protein [Methanogenium cariaci]
MTKKVRDTDEWDQSHSEISQTGGCPPCSRSTTVTTVSTTAPASRRH